MTDVFISYAREDRAFVQRLHDALAHAGQESWVDWEGIPASAKWMAEVRAAIDEADCFCFVVSPASVESPVCREEAAHAASSNKRILPLLYRAVPDGLVPETVAAHNWIEFSAKGDFDGAFATLRDALDTDPEHLRTHTRLLVRAKEWRSAGRSRSALLRGQDLNRAEAWLSNARDKQPIPTALHTDFVLASRRAASRRQRVTIGAVALALVVSLVLSAVAVVQRSEAIEAQETAEREANTSQARALAAEAISQLDQDPELSLLLVTEAASLDRGPQVVDALREVLLRVQIERVLVQNPVGANADSLAVSPDGNVIAASSARRTSTWTLDSGERENTRIRSFAAVKNDGTLLAAHGVVGREPFVVRGDSVVWAQGRRPRTRLEGFVSPIGRFGEGAELVSTDPVSMRVAAVNEDDIVQVWDARSGELLRSIAVAGNTQGLEFGPRDLLATGGNDGRIRLWDISSGRLVSELVGHRGRVPLLEFMPDGTRLVSAADEGTVRLWRLGAGVSEAALPLRARSVAVVPIEGEDRFVVLMQNGVVRTVSSPPEAGSTRFDTGIATRRPSAPAFAVASDGSTVAVMDIEHARIKLFEVDTGSVLGVMPMNISERTAEQVAQGLIPPPPTALAFRPEGDALLVVDGTHTAELRNVVTGDLIVSYRLPDYQVVAVDHDASGD